VCPARPLHTYGSHLPSCPWCDRAALTGHDVFNAPRPVPVPEAVPPPPPPPQDAPQTRRFGPLKVALLLIVLVLIVVVVAGVV